MRVALLLTAAWLLALLGWFAGANTVEKPSGNPPPSTADMWERPVINITLGLPFGDEHHLCSDPLMRLTLRIGIRCGPLRVSCLEMVKPRRGGRRLRLQSLPARRVL
jgi:hypothetical protein